MPLKTHHDEEPVLNLIYFHVVEDNGCRKQRLLCASAAAAYIPVGNTSSRPSAPPPWAAE